MGIKSIIKPAASMQADRSDVRRYHRYPSPHVHVPKERSDEEIDIQTPRNTYEPTIPMIEQPDVERMPKLPKRPRRREV